MFKEVFEEAITTIQQTPHKNQYMPNIGYTVNPSISIKGIEEDQKDFNLNDAVAFRSTLSNETLSPSITYAITDFFVKDFKKLSKSNEHNYQERYAKLILELLNLTSIISQSILYSSISNGKMLLQNEIATLWAIEDIKKTLSCIDFLVKQRKDEELFCIKLPSVVIMLFAISIQYANLNERLNIRGKLINSLPELKPYFKEF
ncbi:hypothetical protein ABC382_00625 [Lysinibacillus sp. 1P01SD]|uniref:hypothetical protein n=1 Tax=Lysinibacillus sp. 1P01SD TaxID=3132285 RepID=UPI0039A03B0D